MQPTNHSYNAIDLLKFICSILVVIIHVPLFGSYENLNTLDFVLTTYVCRLAVPFFFISSGFLIFRKMAISNINYTAIKRYIYKILYLYILWSIIYFPVLLNSYLSNGISFFKFVIVIIRNFMISGSYCTFMVFKCDYCSLYTCSIYVKEKHKTKKHCYYSCSILFYWLIGTKLVWLDKTTKY